MKILNAYILKESALFFAITLLAFTGVLLTLRILKFTSLIVNKGVASSQIIQVFVSIIPTFLEIAIPMSALLGVMMAFARLSGDSEVVVMRASGISIYQLVVPILIFGVAAGLLNLYVSLQLKPWGFQNLSRVLFEIARAKSTSGLTQGVFNSLGNLTIYAEKIEDSSGRLQNVLIDDRRENASRRIIFAKRGTITGEESSRTISLHLYEGEIHENAHERYGTTRFVTNLITLSSADLFDPSAQEKERAPREMSIPELRQSVATASQNLAEAARAVTLSPSAERRAYNDIRKRYHKLQSELGSRFSMPFASFILALIAMPLGIVPPRTQKTWGIGLSLAIGLGVFVLYYGMLSVGLSLSDRGVVPHVIALWCPNLICILVAMFFMQRIASERWLSVADALTSTLARFRTLPTYLRGRSR